MKLAFLQHKRAIPCLLLALLIVTFLTYEPGLYGTFIFDDHLNIAENTGIRITTLSWEQIVTSLNSGIASTIGRPLSMLTFGLNYFFTGLNPLGFKITNVVIHLIASLGIYFLARELLYIGQQPTANDKRRLQLTALFITACWALHPLNVSSVLYIVQRMTLLAAVPVIYALVIDCKTRQNPDITPTQAFLRFCLIVVLLVAGILFKENAVLLVLFIFAIEVFLLHFKAPSRGQQLFLRLYFGVLVVVPAVLGFLILIFAPDKIIGGYDVRAFTMGERLLTEARVIWMYIYWLILPDTRQFTLHHDNFRFPTASSIRFPHSYQSWASSR